MKRYLFTVSLLLVCIASIVLAAEIKPSDVAGKPSAYCTVVKEPNPTLLGHYSCVNRKQNEKGGEFVMEPVEYWLGKLGDKYGLYFYRVKDGKGKAFRGWRKWYLEGDRIRSGESSEIFVKDGDVYFRWKSEKPTKMTRIE